MIFDTIWASLLGRSFISVGTHDSVNISSTRAAGRFCSKPRRSWCFNSFISKEHSFSNSFASSSISLQSWVEKKKSIFGVWKEAYSSDFADSSKLVFGWILQNFFLNFTQADIKNIFLGFCYAIFIFHISIIAVWTRLLLLPLIT